MARSAALAVTRPPSLLQIKLLSVWGPLVDPAHEMPHLWRMWAIILAL